MARETDDEIRARLHRSIPGGAHTYSKGDDQFPDNAPAALMKGKGPYVYDRGGRKFLDYGMGLRSVTLGYGRPDITRAAIKGIQAGNNLTRPTFVEIESAEKLLDFLGWPEMVKFAKNGSNVTTAAVKLARAASGKNHVLIPDTQPFFSFDDWFIGRTPVQRGVLDATASFTRYFKYGSLDSLQAAYAETGGDVAAILLEPITNESPCTIHPDLATFSRVAPCSLEKCRNSNFLYELRDFCSANGIILIFDEMISGLRWANGGGSEYFGVRPDLSTFGKALGNGLSVSALVGRKVIMELGAINSLGAERTFLLSSTHGAEMSSLFAMQKVLKVYEAESVVESLWDVGRRLRTAMSDAIVSSEAGHFVSVVGSSAGFGLSFHPEDIGLANTYRTVFLGNMIEESVLIPWISPSTTHGARQIRATAEATKKSLASMRNLHSVPELMTKFGAPVKGVFRKFN